MSFSRDFCIVSSVAMWLRRCSCQLRKQCLHSHRAVRIVHVGDRHDEHCDKARVRQCAEMQQSEHRRLTWPPKSVDSALAARKHAANQTHAVPARNACRPAEIYRLHDERESGCWPNAGILVFLVFLVFLFGPVPGLSACDCRSAASRLLLRWTTRQPPAVALSRLHVPTRTLF